MSIIACAVCNDYFHAKSTRAKYCSRPCKDRGKPSANTGTCHICKMPMQVKGDRSGPTSHNKCRGANEKGEGRQCGMGGYRGGCRCEVCSAASATYASEWNAKFSAEHGAHFSTVWRRQFQAEFGHWPHSRSSDWISSKLRIEIYERDSWTCYLCELPVDRGGDPNTNRAPSLDHVFPKSLGGSDDPSNLKTACRSCNSRKGVRLVTC